MEEGAEGEGDAAADDAAEAPAEWVKQWVMDHCKIVFMDMRNPFCNQFSRADFELCFCINKQNRK